MRLVCTPFLTDLACSLNTPKRRRWFPGGCSTTSTTRCLDWGSIPGLMRHAVQVACNSTHCGAFWSEKHSNDWDVSCDSRHSPGPYSQAVAQACTRMALEICARDMTGVLPLCRQDITERIDGSAMIVPSFNPFTSLYFPEHTITQENVCGLDGAGGAGEHKW